VGGRPKSDRRQLIAHFAKRARGVRGAVVPEYYARLTVAREFHRFPWELDEVPMDEYLRLLEWLSLEGQLREHTEGHRG
jgi:hypothetical protein